MNFSLRYLTEQKKNIDKIQTEINQSMREKGSNTPYFNIMMTESLKKSQNMNRPTTTLTRRKLTEKDERKMRPQSVNLK